VGAICGCGGDIALKILPIVIGANVSITICQKPRIIISKQYKNLSELTVATLRLVLEHRGSITHIKEAKKMTSHFAQKHSKTDVFTAKIQDQDDFISDELYVLYTSTDEYYLDVDAFMGNYGSEQGRRILIMLERDNSNGYALSNLVFDCRVDGKMKRRIFSKGESTTDINETTKLFKMEFKVSETRDGLPFEISGNVAYLMS
jgi:hypothetical protein